MLSLGYFTKLFKKSFRDSSPHTLRRNVNTILASQRTILESSTTLWLMIVWKSPGQHEPPDPYMILMILSSITFCKLVNTFLSYIDISHCTQHTLSWAAILKYLTSFSTRIILSIVSKYQIVMAQMMCSSVPRLTTSWVITRSKKMCVTHTAAKMIQTGWQS